MVLATDGNGPRVCQAPIGPQGPLLEEQGRPATPEAGSRLAYHGPGVAGWEDMWALQANAAHALGALSYGAAYAGWPQDFEAYAAMQQHYAACWPSTSADSKAQKQKKPSRKHDPESRMPYQPGQLLARSAQYDSPADIQPSAHNHQRRTQASSSTPPCATADAEVRSECSTADTAEGSVTQAQTQEHLPPQEGGPTLLGMPPVPTVGSAGHLLGMCKPCAFVFKGGCANGVECTFCHLCEPGEKKRRKKESKDRRRCMAALRR